MKTLIARKCSDAWIVEIRDVATVPTESDVRILVRQNCLKIDKKISTENRIYAR